jgi:hypothetical protein
LENLVKYFLTLSTFVLAIPSEKGKPFEKVGRKATDLQYTLILEIFAQSYA